MEPALKEQIDAGIVYGNIVIQFRYFFIFGNFAEKEKAGFPKSLPTAVCWNDNVR